MPIHETEQHKREERKTMTIFERWRGLAGTKLPDLDIHDYVLPNGLYVEIKNRDIPSTRYPDVPCDDTKIAGARQKKRPTVFVVRWADMRVGYTPIHKPYRHGWFKRSYGRDDKRDWCGFYKIEDFKWII